MTPRFLAPDLHVDEEIVLPADEAAHAVRVLRLRAGDLIRVFDGRGNEFAARIDVASGRLVRARRLDRVMPAPEPAITLTLAQAVLKTDKMDALVRDATMLGAAVIQPIVTARTNVSPAALRRRHVTDRWRRIAVASVKQCGRAVVPRIDDVVEFADFVRRARADVRVLLVEPSAADETRAADVLDARTVPQTATLMAGPEGGWSGAEVDLARSTGWTSVTLGRRTLRADAAPLVAMAVLQWVWHDL
ncbi:MAG: 16S rRNA (uracil(1498)-N(3))-methyltransferase [Acidobacteria bacterium]|nr:16S rRNA (uracil(1498)-N(3))-methyltransferase [Acidobacteriota bacterium]